MFRLDIRQPLDMFRAGMGYENLYLVSVRKGQHALLQTGELSPGGGFDAQAAAQKAGPENNSQDYDQRAHTHPGMILRRSGYGNAGPLGVDSRCWGNVRPLLPCSVLDREASSPVLWQV